MIGDRAFCVAAPRVWNNLPQAVTSSPSLATFRRRLKTYLFPPELPELTLAISICTVVLQSLTYATLIIFVNNNNNYSNEKREKER